MVALESSDKPDWTIVRAGAERIDDLQPLWESLNSHHVDVAPELEVLGPRREPGDSWVVRRALYEEIFEKPDAFALIADIDSVPVGYALVHTRGPEEAWATSDRIGELETLAVLASHRGRGIGRALVDGTFAELRSQGVRQFTVGVFSSNHDAIRFYERLDLLPFMSFYIGNIPGETP